MIYEPKRDLNLKRYKKGDIVVQYRSGHVYRISGLRWRSECLNVRNLVTGKDEIKHPREFDPCTDPLVLLAAAGVD